MSIELIDELSPKNAGDFALLRDAYLRGGFRSVDLIADRNAIAADRRASNMFVYVGEDNNLYRMPPGDLNDNARWVLVALGGGGGGSSWVQNEFTATAGQITFILSQAPGDLDSVVFTVNGVVYDDVADFTISGLTVTWLNTEFAMEAGDVVLVKYQI